MYLARFFVPVGFLVCVCYVCSTTVTIGAIFHEDNFDFETKMAFTSGIQRVNMLHNSFERPGQRKSKSQGLFYTASIKNVSSHDSYRAGKAACELIESGVVAIFGPESLDCSGIVQSTCSTMEIPHIQIHWNPLDNAFMSGTVLNLHPDPRAFSKALGELVKAMHWKTYMILYQHENGLIRLQDVLKIKREANEPIVVRQMGDGPNYRPLLKEIKQSGVFNIVLDCDTDRILEFLKQAEEVGFLQFYPKILFTSLDAHTIDYGNLLHHKSNMTAIRLVDPYSEEMNRTIANWQGWEDPDTGYAVKIKPTTVRLQTALMYDAIRLFIATLQGMHSVSPISPKKISCDNYTTEKWAHGFGIVEYMKKKRMTPGMTGEISFDQLGRRTDFSLQVIELKPNEEKLTGVLSAKNGFESLRSDEELTSQILKGIQNEEFVVSSRIGAPYLVHRKDWEHNTGNDRYEGFAMDLIDGISKILNFTYKFELAPDNKYGSYNHDTKEWDGLIKELLLRRAHLAICDLTITYDRRSAVDFTMPFMNLGISILYTKTAKEPPSLFSFTSPLSTEVWLYMATAFLGVSFLMYILARMSPSEWENPHPCDQNPEELENVWNFKNSLWFSLGGIMAQGCDILPKGISTRMLSGMWWFFGLILLSSYTAKLAAFLTMERMGPTIESAADLAKQTKIKYGAVLGGSTLEFFKKSNFSVYQRMMTAMNSARPSVFTKSNQEGVERVLKSKRAYAFLMESTSIEYEMARNCELRKVGDILDAKGYGIAMANDFPYRTLISGAVLKMQEEGKLQELKEYWWNKGTTPCEKESKKSAEGEMELDLPNVGGVFIVLFGGMGIAFIIALLEFLWNVRKVAVDEQMTLCEALIVELKFAFNIFITKKAAKPKLAADATSDTKSIAQSVLNKAGSFLHLNVFGNDINSNSKK